MISRYGYFAVLLFAGKPVFTQSFALNPVSRWGGTKCSVVAPSATAVTRQPQACTTTTLAAKLWDRLQIEEDPEPMWYLLNCVAGLEIDLLRQCREICSDLPDAIKFVVPTVIKTRSHGANRMVTETKVTYLGYVFAKIRLCPDVYEAIQELDLCRSWMGTVNHKGYKKLPPAPQALNEIEVENFGLEEVESSEEEEDENPDVILDTAENDKKKPKVDEEALKVYLGLRVDDMVKVTAKGKFFDEDGIVRRLKDGKILVRFYTYGTMYEEWLEPADFRQLSDTEVLKGLGGPDKPVTQEDLDGPQPDRFGRPNDNGRPSELRRGLTGADTRNRRQDRTERGDRGRRDQDEESYRNDKNWNWYKDEKQREDGGDASDKDTSIRAGSSRDRDSNRPDTTRRNRAGHDKWALSDVDSQWGRKPQRQQRREQQSAQTRQGNGQENRRSEAAISGSDDWSAFVSPASSSSGSADSQSDDFFESLMTDLSNDLGTQKGGSSQAASSPVAQKSEDDFFASLMSELSDEPSSSSTAAPNPPPRMERPPPRQQQKQAPVPVSSVPKPASTVGADEDFFAALEAELGNAIEEPGTTTQQSGGGSDESVDFFAKLEAELAPVSNKKTSTPPGASSATENVASKTTQAVMENPTQAPLASSAISTEFGKFTVPVLKEKLREHGLKVGGNKSELIERLRQAS